MRHDEKYLLINQAFAGKQRLMPFFNRTNNEGLILAIQSAGVSRGRNGFFLRFATKALRDNRKDKSSEPLARCNLIAAKARRIGVHRRSRLLSKNTCSNTAPTAPTRFLPYGRSYFVVDTLYIGCEKFPYRDSFSLSMSGVL